MPQQVLRKYPHVFVLADEIYEKIVYDGVKTASLGTLNGMSERVITINGFSKCYSMTG